MKKGFKKFFGVMAVSSILCGGAGVGISADGVSAVLLCTAEWGSGRWVTQPYSSRPKARHTNQADCAGASKIGSLRLL